MTEPLHRNAGWMLLGLAGLFLSLAWMLASPVGASPDEPAHISYAWGIATGQSVVHEKLVKVHEDYVYAWGPVTNKNRKIVGKANREFSVDTSQIIVPRTRTYSATSVQIPQKLLHYPAPRCYRFHQDTPVRECAPTPADNTQLVTTTSYMTRYPPLFYAVAGTELRAATALDLSGSQVLYGARLTSALLSLLAVAFGVFLLARRFPAQVVALITLLALPPMAWFMTGSVNPNGLEIAAAFLLAAGVLALRMDHATGARSLDAVLAVPVGTLLLAWTRPLSWVWASLILCLLLVPTTQTEGDSWRQRRGESWRRRLGELWRQRLGEYWRQRLPLRRLGAVAFAATVLILASSMIWFGYAYPLRSSEAGVTTLPPVWTGLNPFERMILLGLRSGEMLPEMIGNFGWLDTPLPAVAIFAWLAVASAAVVIWLMGRNPFMPRWPVGAVLGLGYLVALLDEYAGAWGWQGRYLLPVTAAACVFAVPGIATVLTQFSALRRLVPPMLVTLITVNVLGVVWFLFRNVHGIEPWVRRRLPDNPLPLGASSWTPLLGEGFVLTLAMLALACGIVSVWKLRPGVTPPQNTPLTR